MSRNRRYTFTINNPTIDKQQCLDLIKNFASVSFAIVGFEIGEKENTPHLQGYIHFCNAIEFESVRVKLFDKKAHIEIARDNDLVNYTYCSKGNDFVMIGNVDNSSNGISSEIIDDILNDMPLKELCKKYYYYVLYHYRDFKKLYDDLRKEKLLNDIDIPF